MMKIRQDQCTASCSELMKLFIESLSSLTSTDKEYFLKWTQILIDALSTDDLTSILQSYDKKSSEILSLKRKHDKSDPLRNKQTELEEISKKLQSATFGLEHIFREMGQIYEAHKSLQKQPEKVQTDWSKYPELAAQLMISGHPMELMDGDADHVPLSWISSLLDEVIRKLGDRRVFVLSVLGVQSSGKSTMLNAMLGLQFAVSAGRCTKGAFMQLVKVSEEMKKDFQFDYILVVDTEGLRALGLEGTSTLHHDNELATFVVCLGNMTLINIFGENPAEMQDVLQIVVQAFMRIKKVKLSPSCVFVHQNVSDVAAAEKNMDGKRRLQEQLDQMAQLAAEEEGCDAECFSDVIAFDVQKDVKYFAQLWEGNPPMAPPNPGYSESVEDLKNFILSKASQSAGVTLSQFKGKIQDLWNALMNKHFVFSFKNTLEISVYRKLEVQYQNWTWILRNNMLTIENKHYTRIEKLSDLFEEISKTYEGIQKDMMTYFDEDKDKEMLVQWRGQFETKIKEFHEELVRGVKRKLDEVLQQKKARKKLEDQKTEFENKLLEKSKELAQQLKDKIKDEEELEKQFNSVWRHWVSELTADIKPTEDINLEDENDPQMFLENKRDQYSNIFRSFCRGSSSAVVLGELICEKLKVSTVEAVCNKTAIDLAGEMRCSFPAFSGNRLNLEKHVLKSLAEKENFDDFITYIQHPREHVESFIKEEVKKYIFTEHKDKTLNIQKKNVEDIKELVIRALFTATEKVKVQRGDTDMWLKEFSSLIKDKMTFDTICSQNFSDISDFELLKKEVEKGLVSIVTETSSFSLEKMKEFRLQPDQILIDQLCRCCWVQCPFCGAVCTNTLENHDGDHSVPFHRSQAVNGWHYIGTVDFVVEFCTTQVASSESFYSPHYQNKLFPYKLYRTAGPDFANWRITPDGSNLPYWKWFVCQFQKQLEDHHDLKFQGRGEIPSEWKTYSKEDAIKSLDEMYNL
uniref:VLIG-type G domain-containing protein n=1 Tax=Anabas testudineus TaxID=64144 RepID=A0AAQ6ICU7_ANATE